MPFPQASGSCPLSCALLMFSVSRAAHAPLAPQEEGRVELNWLPPSSRFLSVKNESLPAHSTGRVPLSRLSDRYLQSQGVCERAASVC